MDEEDLAMASESRHLETVDSVAAVGTAGAGRSSDGFFGLFVTEEETMGVKVVQSMGWRRDQGVGRKVRRTALLDDGTASKDTSSEHMFAPKDARSMSAAPQEIGRKGLGFQSQARLGRTEQDEEDTAPSLTFSFDGLKKTQPVKKAASKKSSFGVGVLNDNGSDDEDPYELGPKIIFNKTLGKEKKAKKPSKFIKPAVADKLVYVPKKTSKNSTVLVSSAALDEKPTLKGFTLAIRTTDLTTKPKFPPPKIPEGWKSSKNIASEGGAQDFESVNNAAKSSTLDAKARASLLGETPLPSRSIFDFIPKEARDRLANLTGKENLPQGLGQSAPDGFQNSDRAPQKDLWSFVPNLDKHIAADTLAKGATGWMPYAEDPQKRARYIGFLELRAEHKQDLPERGEGMSVSDWAKELGEFAHAAQVFKPTSGIMASRFTSSKSTSHSGVDSSSGDNLLRRPAAKIEDAAEQAAKLGMYGPMTRSSLPFHPARLLCKRFNVKPPPDVPDTADFNPGEFDTKAKTEEAVSKSDLDMMMREVATRGPAQQRPAWMSYEREPAAMAIDVLAPPPLDTGGHATVDVEINEALSKERASEDVFKAIFGDSDDEE
jgi:G patch domain-containing protein 1